MNALHKQGLIEDPQNKNKSVWLTAEGLEKGTGIADRLFVADDNIQAPTDQRC